MSQPSPPHECGGRGKDRERAEAPSEKTLAGSLLEAGKILEGKVLELERGTGTARLEALATPCRAAIVKPEEVALGLRTRLLWVCLSDWG